MAVGLFPVAKLGVLFIKQISKPIANLIKTRAKNHPFFSKYVCMPPAQFYNFMEVKTKMWAMNLGKPTNIPQLTEAMAIDLGANLLGEFIIFAIGAGILVLEYQRQARKETLKEEMVLQEKYELVATLNELAFQVERQDTQIRELSRILAENDSRSWMTPPKMLTDIVTRKKVSSENTNPDLHYLPEKKGPTPQIIDQTPQNVPPQGNEQAIYKAVNLIVTDIFCSPKPASNKFEEMNLLGKSINELFPEH
ncbi:unnamed protein product [Diamesa tonsa]